MKRKAPKYLQYHLPRQEKERKKKTPKQKKTASPILYFKLVEILLVLGVRKSLEIKKQMQKYTSTRKKA
jgi:hypothetical protein